MSSIPDPFKVTKGILDVAERNNGIRRANDPRRARWLEAVDMTGKDPDWVAKQCMDLADAEIASALRQVLHG